MARSKHSRTKRLVLDVGSSAVRLCELAQTKTGYQLTKYYQREYLTDPAMSEEEKKTLQISTLAKLLKDAKVRTRKTIFGVPGQSVFVRNRPLPPVPEHKVTQIVRYEIQMQIPFGLDQIALDYQVLNRTEAGGYDVLMAAIKVDVVDKRIEIIRGAKCRVDLVDVCPMAAYNWIKHTGEFGDQGDCVALLDLGATTTDIVIERENQFRFTRSLNLGGNDITSAISNAFGMSFVEAEKVKRERGFAPTGDPQTDGRGGEVIGQVLNRLVSEVNRSFAYFRSQPGGGPVTRIIVTGGGACLRNIIPFLQRQLGIEVRIAQPLSGLAIGPAAQEASEHPEQACVALGLALRCNATVPIEINLVPPRILESARRKEQVFYWALSIVTVMLILATIIPDNAQKDDIVKKQTATVKRALQMYDPELITTGRSESETYLRNAKDTVHKLQGEITALDNIRKNRYIILGKFRAINDARPEGKGLWFSSMETTYIGDDAAGPGMAYRPGIPAAEEDDDGGGFGLRRLGGSGGAAGFNTGLSPGSATATIPSTGFPGITPLMPAGARGFGGRPRPGVGRLGQEEPQEPAAPQRPNGIRVRGYAQDPQTIVQFIDRLKQSNDFKLKNGVSGVYWQDSSMVRRPVSVLDNADTGTGPASMGAALGSSSSSMDAGDRKDERHSERRMFGASRGVGGGVGGFGAANSSVANAQMPNVTSFMVELQYDGARVKPRVMATTSFGGASHLDHGHHRDRD